MSENEEILNLKCNHLEADTIMFSIYCNIGLTDKNIMVLNYATYTNYYTQTATISEKMQGPTCIKKESQLI